MTATGGAAQHGRNQEPIFATADSEDTELLNRKGAKNAKKNFSNQHE